MQSTTRNLVAVLTPSAYTRRMTSPVVYLTSPLNPTSGVTFRVRAFSSSPKSFLLTVPGVSGTFLGGCMADSAYFRAPRDDGDTVFRFMTVVTVEVAPSIWVPVGIEGLYLLRLLDLVKFLGEHLLEVSCYSGLRSRDSFGCLFLVFHLGIAIFIIVHLSTPSCAGLGDTVFRFMTVVTVEVAPSVWVPVGIEGDKYWAMSSQPSLQLYLGGASNVFLPFYLTTGSGEDVLHGLALIFGQLLVEISIRDHASLEGRDGCRSIAFRNGDLLMVETRNVGANWLGSMMEDFVEVIELFSRLLLLANCSTNFSLRAAKDRMDPVGRLMYH
ncbi:hypothetical protein F2Q70_00017090 [Brassica cretica]|uniref:Uncharacterized protein n=1 Tax=Brassica cretica TaxID=69181 RepID=A0A8S9HWG8_BRACR|nr:hypothetical protein F2Q70_00017090 [Brassica cretica]KAF2599048.1 hypothetical protein F2Q68_00010042 [Brassica cretica]